MRVRGLSWVGVQTERLDDMAGFMEALLGAAPSINEERFRLWSLPNGDLVELFAQGDKPTFGPAPVVGFQVDDLPAAREAIEAAGAEVVSTYGPNDDGYATVHFRAPDGNIYEIVFDPQHDTRVASG